MEEFKNYLISKAAVLQVLGGFIDPEGIYGEDDLFQDAILEIQTLPTVFDPMYGEQLDMALELEDPEGLDKPREIVTK